MQYQYSHRWQYESSLIDYLVQENAIRKANGMQRGLAFLIDWYYIGPILVLITASTQGVGSL